MSSCDAMRHVLVGGEALPPALAARFQTRLPHAHLHNAYGPTETTVDATGGLFSSCTVRAALLDVCTGQNSVHLCGCRL